MKKTLYMFFLVPVCILSLFITIYLFSKDEPLFFIKNIKINGASQLEDGAVIDRISPFVRGNIFGIDVQKMKEEVTSHPFVKEVRIKRVFPFSIVIDIKEKTPSALWVNKEGAITVLDEYGEPYKRLARGEIRDMFVINGGNKNDVKSLYREASNWIAEGIIKKSAISEIAYDEGSVTIFGAEDGVEIVLGKEDQKERLKRAVTILEDAKKRGLLIKCIDARFEKGGIIQERKG